MFLQFHLLTVVERNKIIQSNLKLFIRVLYPWLFVGTFLTYHGIALCFSIINPLERNPRCLSLDSIIQNSIELAGRFTKSRINIGIISHSTRAQKGFPIMRKRSVHLNSYIAFFIVLKGLQKFLYSFKKIYATSQENLWKNYSSLYMFDILTFSSLTSNRSKSICHCVKRSRCIMHCFHYTTNFNINRC